MTVAELREALLSCPADANIMLRAAVAGDWAVKGLTIRVNQNWISHEMRGVKEVILHG